MPPEMLRDERQTLLNDILRGLEESTAAYHVDAERASEREVGELMISFERRRSAQAERLEQQIRSLGSLPDALDKDWQMVERWVELLRSENERIREHGRRDAELQALITQALGLEWPPEINTLLQSLREEIAEDRQALLARFG